MKPCILQLDDFLCTDAAQTRLRAHAVVQFTSVDEVLASPNPLPEVTGVLVNIPHKITAAFMDRLPNLRMIANYGVGVDHIDLPAATERGLWVVNTPNVLDKAVADMTFGLIIAACRRLTESHQTMVTNAFTGWTPTFQLGVEVTGKTLGILGLGEIGKQVAKRAHGFDMPVIYHNRKPLPPEEEAQWQVSYRSFEQLLAESDILSIHAPLTPQTHGLFNAVTLARMKRGAVLINTSRGALVQEEALAQALKCGHLFAAGLDVFEKEPIAHPDLVKLPNVVLAAHIASATHETRRTMGDQVIDALLTGLNGQTPPGLVNPTVVVSAASSTFS
jgi:glyoxylate reductase